MNRAYRLIWSDALGAFIPVAETARGRGKGSGRTLSAAALSLTAALAQATPTGGQITGGNGTITQAGATTTIQQSTQNLAVNWQSFNIAPQETVNFVQPSATAVAVNRILGNSSTTILGHLDANGQVYLINPNGVIFGKGSQVNVGGLVASTLALDSSTPNDAVKNFVGTGSGEVINEGTITAASGGSVALLGSTVSNTGVISAQLGSVALGAGSAATLTFHGSNLVSMQIDRSVLNSMASNGGLIRADGGQVLMTAGAEKALLASVVNNTGVIEARTLENHAGVITLLGGKGAGTVNVGGTLDASAPDGGHGGSIETSAAHVEIANDAKVTTAAASGLTGSWLIDPTDFTIAASGGDETGATLSTALLSNDINIVSSSGTHGGTAGNINVNDAVTWSSHLLTLTATNDVNINAVMTANNTASLDLQPGTGTVNVGISPTTGAFLGQVNFFQANGTTPRGGTGFLTIAGVPYTVITTLGVVGSTTGTDLQGINGNLAGHFALGSDIDASGTANAGFSTIGSMTVDPNYGNITSTTPFTGVFDGLGHSISNLTVNQYYTEGDGLFGVTSTTSIIRNVGVISSSVLGAQSVGLLVGRNQGSISNSYGTGAVTATEFNNGLPCVGGLVGRNDGEISTSYAAVSVVGRANVGGLVGANYGTIDKSFATGSVQGSNYPHVGGLVGANYSGAINNSYATGNVSSTVGSNEIGGLVGSNTGILSNSFYNADQVAINGSHQLTLGGLYNAQYTDWLNHNEALAIGNYASSLPAGSGGYYNVSSVQGFEDLLGFSESNAANNFRLTANISLPAGLYVTYFAGSFDGAGYTLSGLSVNIPNNSNIGLFGYLPSSATLITNVHVVNGNVTGYEDVGGLIGNIPTGVSLSASSFAGSVQGYKYVGGLVGNNQGTITASSATGSVGVSNGNYGYATGGLVGVNYGSISNSYSTSTVSGNESVGGLVGSNSASISNSYATGDVTGGYAAGGLAGGNYGSISNSYASGVVTASSAAAGLVGYNSGSISNSFYNSTANSSLTGVDGSADAAGTVMGLSSTDLQTPTNFTSAGWDLASTWIVYQGETNPLLRAFMTPLVIGGGVTTQIYNGNAFAPSVSGLNYSIAADTTHVLGTVTVAGTASGALHTGTYTFTAGGLYSDQLGYMISYIPGSLTITPAQLTVSGTTVGNRVYNGTTVAALSNGSLVGVIGSDTVTLIQAGSYASKNVGSGIAVSVADGLSGPSAGDYTITEPVGLTGTITPATLTVSGTTIGSKVYNGTTMAPLTGGSLVGVIGGDSVLLSQGGSFASKNVGAGLTVTASDSLSGPSASNYSIAQPVGLTGTITPASLTVTGTTVGNSVYNGTTAASLMGGTLAGVVSGDSVSLVQAGTYASKNVGTGIPVAASDSLAGTSAVDYSITQPVGLTGTITPASLTVTGTTVGNSVYNGTTAASLMGGMLVGVVNGDMVSLAQAGTYASKNPATGIAVTATDTLRGPSAGDYSITQPVGLTGAITPDYLSVVGTVVGSKVYNGTSSAPLTGGTLVGVVSGDSVTLIQSGTFASTSVGSGIAVTVTDSLSGPNAADYSITQPTGLTGTISPATSGTTPTSPSAPIQAAQMASTEVQSTFASPQLGGGPQAINASPTIVAVNVPSGDASASSTTDSSIASSITDSSSASSGSSSSGGSSATGNSSPAVTKKAVAVNVSMKIGATGTLTIQAGGLRLPQNLTVDNQ